MGRFAHWARSLVLIAPAGLLLYLAVPRLETGLAIDAAYPVPVMMTVGTPLPQATYLRTAEILGHASGADGITQLQRAEAAALAGQPNADVVGLLEEGLEAYPASVRGWALYSEQVEANDPSRAAEALSVSLLLGPYEYYVAERRAKDAAVLWEQLPEDSRELALRQARILWTEASLNDALLRVMGSEGGSELVARAFVGQPEEMRAINRLIAAKRAGLAR